MRELTCVAESVARSSFARWQIDGVHRRRNGTARQRHHRELPYARGWEVADLEERCDPLRWRPDGREIIYYASDGELMGVPIRIGAAPEIGAAVPLFEAHLLGPPAPRLGYGAQFDVAPDGRLLLNMPVEDSSPSPINVVVNWRALLKK